MKYQLLLVLLRSKSHVHGHWPEFTVMNIYTKRKEGLTGSFLDALSVEPGIKVNLVTGAGDAMIKWLKIDYQVVCPARDKQSVHRL